MGVKIRDDFEEELRTRVEGQRILGNLEQRTIPLLYSTLDKLLKEIDYWRKEANRAWRADSE